MKTALEEADINLKEMKAEFRANSEEFEALLRTLVSRIDIHQARIDTNQESWKPRWTIITRS
jgi:hypothetical protein